MPMFEIVREASFGNRVRERRMALHASQTQLAEEMGLSRQHFNNWEKGYTKPKGKRMIQLATVLNCDPIWLQHGDGSEVGERIDNAMTLMRHVVRELEHIHRALSAKAGTARRQ